ncbi:MULTISPECIES: hydroxyectoine utilization dehydratase EutB [Actibacterium]|uniref:Threonine dehydratase n=1 Tax=Actibacterium naphthalenivorans TaxID=1614693 RepID=A0A840C8T8_9RHOB|nr:MULTISPECIES: hydroxyectoine utilization dehydratase EutB [Actibacterium]ALG90413.1 threonine dehydratase [Actibacterium sp. EMB200-NS6]MBB4022351.1 threonine dehydratase [Actibacterium naphthalenivorans]
MNAPVLADILSAHQRVAGIVRATPCDPSPSLSTHMGQPVWLKQEHHQHTGSFKLRGAANAVAQLTPAERARGVVAVSTGNHGRALAYAARKSGVRCVICMSALVPDNKLQAIRAEGAETRIIGRSQDEAQAEVDRMIQEDGMVMIPPFDDPRVIAGQGTLGLEVLEAVPDLATMLVQLSGGGLIAGVALALKAQRPDIRVIGISMKRGAAMQASLAAGRPVQVDELPTLADSLGGGIGLANQYSFAMARDLVDDVVTLSEPEIAAGIRHCYFAERQIVEGAGAVGVAALLSGRITAQGPVGVLLSGGNIDMALHHRLISGEDVDLMQEQRA